MRKLWCFILCLLAFKGMAQTDVGALFDVTDENIYGKSTEQTFTGKPIVLIEKQEKPSQEINKAEQLPPPNLRKNTLNIPIKTFFGHEKTAAFIDHTTDFFVMIQVMDDKTVHITEQIQFITTKDGEKFKRFFSDKQPRFLSLKRDNSFVAFEVNEQSNGTEILYDRPLPKGVHKMTLEYLLPDSFKVNRSLAEVTLPITGPRWGQIIERMAVVMMMPKKSRFYEKEFLFGSNNQKIPENTKISEDEKGVLTFQNTHPLPAFADVRLHLVLDAKDLPSAEKEGNLSLKTIGLFALILLGYVILSILTARFKKWKRPLAESKKINPILWSEEAGIVFNDYQLNLLQKSDRPIRFINTSKLWIKILTFLRFNYEYLIGSVLLILATKYVANYTKTEISGMVYAVFLILCVGGIFIIDYYGTRVQMKKLGDTLRQILLNDLQGLNLAKREIPTYYYIAVCWGYHAVWEKRLLANNPSYKELTCFEKEK